MPNFAAACVLLRVWARAQALDAGADALGGFLLTMLLVDLVQKGSAVSQPELHSLRACLVGHVRWTTMHSVCVHAGWPQKVPHSQGSARCSAVLLA